MYLIYLDEAGNTGDRLDDPDQPIHVVGGIIIRDENWLAIEMAFNALVGVVVPLKADQTGFEFHASDIFFGHGAFDGWKEADRHKVFADLISIITNNKVPIVYGAINKPELNRKYAYPQSPHDLAFLLCAERVERWFKNHAPDHVGMFIADETRAKKGMKASLPRYREQISFGTRGERLEHIIETIHFADSRETYGIQLADVANYLIKRKLMGKANTQPFYESLRPVIYAGRTFPP
jgi:hypothetical protein